jgi:hypothetical protein
MTAELEFSVVIPVFNREKLIAHAVRSVLNQNHNSFEVIVVNDGSTDGTLEVLQNIQDSRLKIINRTNGERGAARNAGTQAAAGKYITFLDSDDEFLEQHLVKAESFINNTSEDVVMFCTGYYKESEKGVNEFRMPENIRAALIIGNFLSCNGVFLKREIALKYPFSEVREMSGLEDWELWLRITAAEKHAGADLMSSRMRYHAERSVLQTHPEEIVKRFSAFYKSLDAHQGIIPASELGRFRSSCESYIALHLALTGNHKKAALHHLKKAFSCDAGIVFSRRFYAILKHLI